MSSEHKFSYSSAVPLDVSWKTLRKGDQLLPKLLPPFFAKIERPWRVTVARALFGLYVTLGEGLGPQRAGKQVKERVDVLDDATTFIYSIIEGGDPRYTDIRTTLKISAAGNSTITEWTISYTPPNSDVPPPKHLEGCAKATAKALEGYAKEHLSEFAYSRLWVPFRDQSVSRQDRRE